MFPEINSALRLDKHSIENKRINIVQAPSTDGSFFLHHFISLAAKSNYNILIIAFEQTIGHFHGVGMKLGYDLLKLQKKGQAIFYDVLKNSHMAYMCDANHSEIADSIFDFDTNLTRAIPRLSSAIKQKMNEFKDQSIPSFVFIDKLSVLLSLNVKLSSVISFIIDLQFFVEEKNGSLVTLTSGLSNRKSEVTHFHDHDVNDEQENKLTSFLDHTSHLSVIVWKLATGYSEIVSGNFYFGWTPEGDMQHNLQDTGRYQYNIEEKDVKVFALGTSSAVL